MIATKETLAAFTDLIHDYVKVNGGGGLGGGKELKQKEFNKGIKG